MTSYFPTPCLDSLPTAGPHIPADPSQPSAQPPSGRDVGATLSLASRYDVYVEESYPQFRRNPATEPFGDEWFEERWIATVNADFREIVDTFPPPLLSFHGIAPYAQFEAAFRMFDTRYRQINDLGYRVADAPQVLADQHNIHVSLGYCALGAKVAGFDLRYDSEDDSPMIDPHRVIAEIKRDDYTDDGRYDSPYSLGV